MVFGNPSFYREHNQCRCRSRRNGGLASTSRRRAELFIRCSIWLHLCVGANIFEYRRYVAILKWLTLVLFAYVLALAVVKVPWSEAIRGLLVPTIQWDKAFLTTLVALLGTTISPYLFVWQSSQEAEEQRIDPDKNHSS